ncbi:cytochrome C [Desulfuromonas sp. CSMB_57]|uniref:cytochrome C n=1 Tax=Desulfuromonas sp. CSMB_57 TaxID=2807629 RepID=UPI001CD42B8F|nr:cytochrome C [Desulfuromonas sp. CSMB_57]
MRKWLWILLPAAAVILGCAMFTTWKAIPPPGGCDQCHTLPISANWQVTVSPVILGDETGRYHWQRETSVLPAEEAPIQQQKLVDEPCFRCHKSPSRAHTERLGRFHH